ncbi:MAG: CoA-transferase [Myxococcales bacterium]|nr:CoA-transferase [Myxococcales bacterium]
MSDATRAEVCVAAVADAFRNDGEALASAFGAVPTVGVRLAKLSDAPDLLMTDGIAYLRGDVPSLSGEDAGEPVVEGWLPFRKVFDLLWSGRRHVIMTASQIDRFGNHNFACIGDYRKPKAQLLGMRGAPGNTIHHATSYWVPNHSPKVFVEKVDVVSGVGNDRAAALGPAGARFHDIRCVISNLGVFDFATPERRMRLASVHPGVGVDEVVAQTGFELAVPDEVPHTRWPTPAELALMRERIDPRGFVNREVPA